MPTNYPKISFWSRLFDLLMPRTCAMCNERLAISEETICSKCNLDLARTHYYANSLDNEMARIFWGRVPVERCAALSFYGSGSMFSKAIYRLKYGNCPEIGVGFGEIAAEDMLPSGFFEGIDLIVPVPLADKRLRQRGYNQSEEIAKGVSQVTGIKVEPKLLRRKVNTQTQTNKNRWARADNVEHAFELAKQPAKDCHHILLIDDVVTTGATLCACAKCLSVIPDIKISFLCLGFASPAPPLPNPYINK